MDYFDGGCACNDDFILFCLLVCFLWSSNTSMVIILRKNLVRLKMLWMLWCFETVDLRRQENYLFLSWDEYRYKSKDTFIVK